MENTGGERPLSGLRVVVTRAREQARDLVDGLERLGAEVIPFPTIAVAGPADPAPLRSAARRVAEYDWIVFTSANGVDSFWAELEQAGGDAAAALGSARIACVGPATAAALRERGIEADAVPDEFVAEGLVEALARGGEVAGRRVLLPQAEAARPVVAEGLAAAGARVDAVVAYRTVPGAPDAEPMIRQLEAGGVDLVTFTSPSTVRNFVGAVGGSARRAPAAVIGPVTGDAARACGLRVAVVAQEHTAAGLVDAIVEAFGRLASPGA